MARVPKVTVCMMNRRDTSSFWCFSIQVSCLEKENLPKPGNWYRPPAHQEIILVVPVAVATKYLADLGWIYCYCHNSEGRVTIHNLWLFGWDLVNVGLLFWEQPCLTYVFKATVVAFLKGCNWGVLLLIHEELESEDALLAIKSQMLMGICNSRHFPVFMWPFFT